MNKRIDTIITVDITILLLALISAVPAFGQCGKLALNPLTSQLDCTGPAGAGSGTVTSIGVAGTTKQITITGASPITTSGSLTISIPTDLLLPGSLTLGSGYYIDGTAAAAPANPSAGLFRLYVKTATGWCQRDSAGTETCFGATGGTVTSVGLAGTANQITITGTSPITASGSWTASLPSNLLLPDNLDLTAAAAPANPASGKYRIYAKTSTGLCQRDSAGTESCIGAGTMVYPGAGVANSTGSAWGASYAVGTSASNLVQLNGSSQLPAVSGALLTDLPAANVTLSNLTSNSVGLNTDLKPGSWGAVNLGTSLLPFGTLTISGATSGQGGYALIQAASADTSARSIALPAASGTVSLASTSTTNKQLLAATTTAGLGAHLTDNIGVTKLSSGVPGSAAYTDVTALWTTCTSGWLKYDGTCTTPGGGGTVTSSGSPLIHQVSVFTTGTDIKGIAVGATGTLFQGATGADPAWTATPSLGTDNSTAGTFQLANGSANAHTIWGSGATTSNTVLGPATVPTTGHLLDCSTSSTTCTLHDSGVATANVVTSAAALTSTALMTGAGSQGAQTPAATATLDASGNISTPGSISTGVGGSVAGILGLGQGTAPSTGTTMIKLHAPTSVTSYNLVLPGSSATGFLLGTNAANVNTLSFVGSTGSGSVTLATSPAFTTDIHAVSAGGATNGTAALPWSDLYFAGTSGTPATNHFKVTGASTSGERVFTVPDSATSWAVTEKASRTANQFVTHITSGTQTTAAIAAADLPATLTSGTAIVNAALTTPAIGAATGTSVTLGTDNSVAGTVQVANSAANAHTIWTSGATTTNTIAGPATVPTTGHLLDCTTASTTCTLHDSGVVTANVVNASSPAAGIAHFAGSTQTVTSSAVVNGDLGANAVDSAKMAVVNTRRVCDISVGDTSGSALANAALGPQKRICFVPAAATIVEIDVAADGGTPNVIVGVNAAGSVSNLVSGALATASSGGIACSKTTAVTGIDGATTCSATLQNNTSVAAGSYIELVSGTAGGVAKFMTIHVIYTVN